MANRRPASGSRLRDTEASTTSKTSTSTTAQAATSAKPAHSAQVAESGRAAKASRKAPRTRSATLRLVHVDPFSVMKIAFLLSIALGIIAIVAVLIIWGVLGAAGVWGSINSSVQQTVGSDSSKPFNITDYIGTGRVVGFTMIASVIDVVVLTALATLGAFVYNLAATLLGGVEMTFAEDR